ncbi:MAG: LPP20 family lipoprotein, partial [Candidatus Poribacteria bacterium]
MKKAVFILVYTLILLPIILLPITIFGCGGKEKTPAAQPVVSPANTPEGMEVQVPDWYIKPPSDPNYLYASGTFKATDMGFSIEHAMQVGRDELARQISVRVTNMMKRYQEETGGDEESAEFLSTVSTVSKSITDEVIAGSSCKERKIYKEGTKSFRSYALMGLPIGTVNASLLEKIKENK